VFDEGVEILGPVVGCAVACVVAIEEIVDVAPKDIMEVVEFVLLEAIEELIMKTD
jgi:hypothetical protein